MDANSWFRYDGRQVLVVGGATGMGAATAQAIGEMGGRVVVLDHAPVGFDVAASFSVDLRDRGQIDAALDQIDGPVHSVVSAAGVADGTPGLMRINFIGHRHVVEQLVSSGRLGQGGAVCFVSSVAGLGWENSIPTLLDLLATPDYESADAWVAAHEGTDNYAFSKQVINCYVAHRAYPFLAKGVRINAICPGPTDTPLARANADIWLAFAQDYRDATGTQHLTPEQMAGAIAFLNSDAASGVSGVNLLVDAGHVMSSLTGSWQPGQAMINALMGR